MGNGVSSTLFMFRGLDKVENGELPRFAPTIGQGVNTAKAVAGAEIIGSKAACGALHMLEEASKKQSIWGKTAKGALWASNHVNPLIGVCAGVKILTSDDKEKAVCTEIPGFAGMLAAESQLKKFQKTKTSKNMLAKISKAGGKHGKMLGAVVEGGLFAAASIGGYLASAKVGEYLIEGERALRARKSLEGLA